MHKTWATAAQTVSTGIRSSDTALEACARPAGCQASTRSSRKSAIASAPQEAARCGDAGVVPEIEIGAAQETRKRRELGRTKPVPAERSSRLAGLPLERSLCFPGDDRAAHAHVLETARDFEKVGEPPPLRLPPLPDEGRRIFAGVAPGATLGDLRLMISSQAAAWHTRQSPPPRRPQFLEC